MTPLTARQMLRRLPSSCAFHAVFSAARPGSLSDVWPNRIGITFALTNFKLSQRATKLSFLYFATLSAGSASADVSHKISERTSCGWRAASRMPTKPPMLSPQKWTFPSFNAAMRATASSVNWSIPISDPRESAL